MIIDYVDDDSDLAQMGFYALKARRNRPEYFVLLAYSLSEPDDQLFIYVRHLYLLVAG